MLRPDILQQVTKIWLNHLASRLNAQVSCYASWGPDPGTPYVDVLSISWETQFFYALPPFSLIAHCLHKIVGVEAEGIMIVPF